MTIPEELRNFKDENEFADEFLVPLLQRLGFSTIANYPGSTKFGKGIIFGSVDKFGHVIYNRLQTKHRARISVNDIEGLISDAKQAFNNPFEHPNTGQSIRISTFYGVNSGSFSTQAETTFFSALSNPFGGNARLLDGKQLLHLDRGAALDREQGILDQLQSILLEINTNKVIASYAPGIFSKYLEDGKIYPLDRFSVNAISAYLQKPTFFKDMPVDLLFSYVDSCRASNDLMDQILQKDVSENGLSPIGENVTKIIQMGQEIKARIDTIKSTLLEPVADI